MRDLRTASRSRPLRHGLHAIQRGTVRVDSPTGFFGDMEQAGKYMLRGAPARYRVQEGFPEARKVPYVPSVRGGRGRLRSDDCQRENERQ